MKSLTFVEIDIPYCANTYGVAPCTASVPTTGADKCYNCLATCQDTAHLINAPVTLRFAFPTVDLPSDIECIASLGSIDHVPGIISLGSDLGQRASLTVQFKDHQFSDTPSGFDKYFSTRSYNPYKQGTFWGKFRARQPYLKGANLRLITGLVGQAVADMETRHFIIDSFSGPTLNGTFTIVAKDIIKLADGDKAQAPVASQGYLLADITAGATSLTLTPSGIGDLEYDVSGYVCLAGNEVVSYIRDQYTKLLVHAEGANNATVLNDDSGYLRVATFNGSAKISTSQFKFGSSSLSLGAAGNFVTFPDSDDFAFGANPFTIDIFCYFTSVPAGAPNSVLDNVLWWQEDGGGANQILLGFDGTSIYFIVRSASSIIGSYSVAHGMSNTTWHHWRVCRSGSTVYLFRDGTLLTLTINTNLGATAIPNIAGVWNIGGQTVAGPTFAEDCRILKGVALSTSSFTPIATAFTNIAGGDTLLIVRGLFNTTAAAHSASDRVQKCLYYLAQDVANIIYDLYVNYTNIDASYTSLAAWLLETSTYLQRVFTAMITEPTAVNTLINELITEGGLAIWPDEIEQTIRLQVLRAVTADAATITDDIYKRGSLGIMEQPNTRLTQVWMHFGKINPTLAQDRVDNYRNVDVRIDSASENNYGVPAVKKIFSRWIPQGGRSIAQRVSDIWLARYVNPPRKFSFDLARYGPKDVLLGGGYYISSPHLQDAAGAQLTRPLQITQLQVTDTALKAVAEESNWQTFAYDGSERVITIDTNSYNLNMKTLHDALYPTIVGGETVTLIIANGATLGSTLTSVAALDIGTWPILPTLKLKVYGKIQGKGGKGGYAYATALPGGDALKTTVAIELIGTGNIWAGAGGGDGLSHTLTGITDLGGGGGAGFNGGEGGDTTPGNPGTDSAGGTGASGYSRVTFIAFTGGGPGLTGLGPTAGLSTTGLPGKSINGIASVTNHSTCDIRGPTV